MMPVCLVTGDVDLSPLVKVVSAGFLHCVVIFFPLCNEYISEGNTLQEKFLTSVCNSIFFLPVGTHFRFSNKSYCEYKNHLKHFFPL